MAAKIGNEEPIDGEPLVVVVVVGAVGVAVGPVAVEPVAVGVAVGPVAVEPVDVGVAVGPVAVGVAVGPVAVDSVEVLSSFINLSPLMCTAAP